MVEQDSLTIQTDGRAIIDITPKIESLLGRSSIKTGLCSVFVHHTSASLIVTENADTRVCRDLENYISKMVIDGDITYQHNQEGADDMAAHIRSVLTQTEVSIPVQNGSLALGTWQGLYLWEHRRQGHRRQVIVTLHGE